MVLCIQTSTLLPWSPSFQPHCYVASALWVMVATVQLQKLMLTSGVVSSAIGLCCPSAGWFCDLEILWGLRAGVRGSTGGPEACRRRGWVWGQTEGLLDIWDLGESVIV